MTLTPRSHFIRVMSPSGWKTLRYFEWGDPLQDEVVICVHGLTRNGRDFDALAEALAPDFRVIAPDMLGRGQSDWLATPEEYSYSRYVLDAAMLIARANVDRVHWVGTSMGGIIGMMLDASRDAPLKSLVLNDVGSFIPLAALKELALYVGKNPTFKTIAEASLYLARVHAPFGTLPESYWQAMAMNSVRQEGGVYRLHYDPKIAGVFNAASFDIDLGLTWSSGRAPALLLRGAESGLFLAETLAQMLEVRPGTESAVFAGIGHAPSLAVPDQIERIRRFLMRHRLT